MRNVAKRLKFPLLGVAKNLSYQDTTYPTEGREYATPMAVNVIGSCVFEGRTRGGSRPGLARIEGISGEGRGKWLWPNGEKILWPDGKELSFADYGDAITLPDGTRILQQHRAFTIYRDRLLKYDGSVWMASRTGDFSDFDFGADGDDVSRAVAGNIALAGRKGENITAFAPVNDKVLFVATKRAIRMVSGEPTELVQPISDSVGIVSANAWCFDGQRVWFIGPNGLYAMAPGESPLLASSQLPDDFKGWNEATLVYDPENRGIHILHAEGSLDYFYDIEAKAVWPLSYNAEVRPTVGGVAVIGGVNKVVFRAGTDWYYWDESSDKDAGLYYVASKVVIGPFRCGARDDGDGILDALTTTLASGSAAVNISVNTAKSAEAAVESCALASMREFVAAPGWNRVSRPRIRGAWAVITLSSTGRWAYESILANIKTLGRLRP